ncbi:MAG: DUF177 domain-containing protein [Clostridia bacterium]|nr:DUF177 domain-containing protein [Clostridia bacterium]
MILQVRQISSQDKPIPISGSVPIVPVHEFESTDNVAFTGEAISLGEGIIQVSGTLRFHVAAPCARCLKPVVSEIETNICERFVPVGVEKEEEELYTYEGDELDLMQALQEAALIALPMRVLCSEDCAGLCPQCGADLNEGPCGCPTQSDNPFSILQQIEFPQEV